jgi:hypothetical protein
LVGGKEVVAGDSGLSADGAESRAFNAGMIGEGERRSCAVGFRAEHGDVLSFADELEAEAFEGADDAGFWGVDGKLGH